MCVFVETCGTKQGSPIVDDITNVLNIEFGCRLGATAVSLVLREPKHQETTAYWHVRRCESRGDQNGTHDTADAAAGDNCRRQGKSFKTKSVREVLEVYVLKGSPDVQKTAFGRRPTSIQMPTRTVSSPQPTPNSQCLQAKLRILEPGQETRPSQSQQQSQRLLVMLSSWNRKVQCHDSSELECLIVTAA